jgi:hypothetical protein
VRALLRKGGGGTPEDIIRSKSRQLVAKAKALGWDGPPFDPLLLASIQGILSRETRELFSAEAQLTPIEGRQLLLEFNPDRSTGRRNFSISHEIAHTFFEDCYEMVHQRRANPLTFDPQQEVEHLCQVGAAEILMPYEDFKMDAASLPLSLNSVSSLAQRYGASREATARRMLGVSGRTGALVFFSKRLKPSEVRSGTAAEAKLRILYVVPFGDFSVFLPPHKSAPNNSCVCCVTSPDEVAAKNESWDIQGFDDWFVEAMALPIPLESGSEAPSVMALVLPRK